MRIFPQPSLSFLCLCFLALNQRTATASDPAPPTVAIQNDRTAPSKWFTDVTHDAGFRHVHRKPALDHQLDNIMSWVASVGAAAAAADYNADGWIDLYVTNSDKGAPNYLYRNNRDGTFTDVASQAGLADVNGDKGVSTDCKWGDFDNDGRPDLYLVRWGNNALFHNNGDGTFTDVTARHFRKKDGSPGTEWANACAAVWLDFDRDGRLDIYVGNYFDNHDLWHLTTTRIMHDDFEQARNGGRNYLYHQQPDGSFKEVGAELGVDDPGWTLAVGAADVNNDGWPDLYCANDFGPDQFFLNTGHGTFRNVSREVIGTDTKKGMNVDFGDFDNDGWLDIFATNITTSEYLQEGNMLWHNAGVGPDGSIKLADISLETGTYDGGWGWGGKFFDYDNDGDLDIISVNGFISAGEGNYWYDLASWTVTGEEAADAKNWPAIGNRSFSGYETTRLWRNDGMFTFTQRAAELGVDDKLDGRGVVCFDYDNDGDLDVFVANQNQPPIFYRNDGPRGSHWLMVSLEADPATKSNREAVGTRLTLVRDRGTQIRERDGGNSYCGQSDPRVHFGLGTDSAVKRLEIRWPDGGVQVIRDVGVDRVVRVRQDRSAYVGELVADRPKVTPPAPEPKAQAAEPSKASAPSETPKDTDATFAATERSLRAGMTAYAPASEYRLRCAQSDNHDRSISFFEKWVKQEPKNHRARIELALAYIDKIPTRGGVAAIVSKGTLARKGLDQLDEVIKAQPESWVAFYCRGMNHLHWPRSLRHSDDAASDFRRCIEFQNKELEDGKPIRPYWERVYVAIGDAYAKAGEYEDGRRSWREGAKLFPQSTDFPARLAITEDKELLKFVESKRSLESPLDTSLAFLDGQ